MQLPGERSIHTFDVKLVPIVGKELGAYDRELGYCRHGVDCQRSAQGERGQVF